MRSHLYRLRRSVSDPIFSLWFSFKVSPVSSVSPMAPMTLVSPVFPVSPVPIAHPPASEAWFVSGAFLESWMFRDSKKIGKWHSYFSLVGAIFAEPLRQIEKIHWLKNWLCIFILILRTISRSTWAVEGRLTSWREDWVLHQVLRIRLAWLYHGCGLY